MPIVNEIRFSCILRYSLNLEGKFEVRFFIMNLGTSVLEPSLQGLIQTSTEKAVGMRRQVHVLGLVMCPQNSSGSSKDPLYPM